MRIPTDTCALKCAGARLGGVPGFTDAEAQWTARLGNLRNVVRQHVIAEQLAVHLGDVRSVLDVGCGQGTQAIRLAMRGLTVTGIDPSVNLLARARSAAEEAGCAVPAPCLAYP